MMSAMALASTKLPVYLIALAFGYVVCYLASREEKDFKTIGYSLGIFIISVSTFFIVRILMLYLKVFGIVK